MKLMRALASLALAMALFASPGLAFADAPNESTYVAPLADPALEARASALQKQLRCVVCQGQSIDESNAPLAADIRKLIREQIAAGKSDDDIEAFLVARYGVFVLMKPPVRQDTFFLWFGPLAIVLVGGLVIGVTIIHARRRLAAEPVQNFEGEQ